MYPPPPTPHQVHRLLLRHLLHLEPLQAFKLTRRHRTVLSDRLLGMRHRG